MKAVLFERLGGPEVLEYRDVPDPMAGPAKVEFLASRKNFGKIVLIP